MMLVPITRGEARTFVAEHHRHNDPPPVSVFQVGLRRVSDGALVGVAMAGRPSARLIDPGEWLEVTRVATTGERNANSMLYGACARAAAALGYRRLVTYTLPDESGASLKASGWTQDGMTGGGGWNRPNLGRIREQPRLMDDFHKGRPQGPKQRWIKEL